MVLIAVLVLLANQPKSTSVEEPVVAEPNPVETPAGPTAGLSVTMPNHYGSSNCTTAWGPLMLINPNFPVETNFITQRQGELINLTATYDIQEGNSGNGVPLLDEEAAGHLNEMVQAYQSAYPGHTLTTRSCFRARGTTCGRLCVATDGSMSEPANIDAGGSAGLWEAWHYRYVGVDAAHEIASGKYNNGNYDSLEHSLKAAGVITNLIDMPATCQN